MADTLYTTENVKKAYSILAQSYNLPKELKPRQIESIIATLNHRDLLCILATSGGKSLIMFLPPLLRSIHEHKNVTTAIGTLIISPLDALMSNMISSYSKIGFRCYRLTSDSMTNGHLQNWLSSGIGPYYLLGSPEVAFKREYMQQLVKIIDLSHVCIDESHVVVDWGMDKNGESAFRSSYGNVSLFRCFVKNQPTLSLFSATMDTKMVSQVKSITGINLRNLTEVVEPPNRPNIFLNAVVSKNTVETLLFLIDEMKLKNTETTKTIVFCNTIGQCTSIAKFFWMSLGENRKASSSEQNIFSVFDGVSDEKSREKVLEEFSSENSKIRVVIATVAFGMGVNIADARRVVLFGTPYSILDCIQKIGRVGRDGKRSEAIILIFNTQSNLRRRFTLHIERMDCVREFLAKQTYKSEGFRIQHVLHTSCSQTPCRCSMCNCCSICRIRCPCFAK